MTNLPGEEPASFNQNPKGGDIATTYSIGKWLMEAREKGATHVIVVCDTFDCRDYPVQVMPDEDVHEVEARYCAASMQKSYGSILA